MAKKENAADEKNLWGRVARTVSPLRTGSSKPEKQEFLNMLQITDIQNIRPKKNQGPVFTRQDKKTRRGKIVFDGKLDLHDLTQPEAFSKLRHGIIRSFNQNKKCILVVTGKGLRGQGVLRQNLPTWLEHPDIRHVIAEYAPAHIKHGGGGAWYVFLKTEK